MLLNYWLELEFWMNVSGSLSTPASPIIPFHLRLRRFYIWPMPWWGCNWTPNHTVIIRVDPRRVADRVCSFLPVLSAARVHRPNRIGLQCIMQPHSHLVSFRSTQCIVGGKTNCSILTDLKGFLLLPLAVLADSDRERERDGLEHLICSVEDLCCRVGQTRLHAGTVNDLVPEKLYKKNRTIGSSD